MSDANRTRLVYATEGSWNTAATGTMTELRYTGESLIPEISTIQSAELRSDRMISDIIQVSRQNSGGVDFEMSYATFDNILESAFYSTWATDTLKNGVTEKSFTIEKGHLDINEYFLFQGMVVNTMTMNMSTGAICTGNLGFFGAAATLAQASFAATITAANTNDIMNCMNNVSELQEGASAATFTPLTGIYIQELSFTINNNIRPISAIGYNTIQDLAVGKMDITGTMNAYFASDRLYDKFLAGSALMLRYTIADAAGNSYQFYFPKIKFETASVTAPGQDQDVIENLTWRALKDSTEDAQIRVIRNTA